MTLVCNKCGELSYDSMFCSHCGSDDIKPASDSMSSDPTLKEQLIQIALTEGVAATKSHLSKIVEIWNRHLR